MAAKKSETGTFDSVQVFEGEKPGEFQDYFDEIAVAMRSADIINPRELSDVVVEAIKARHGL